MGNTYLLFTLRPLIFRFFKTSFSLVKLSTRQVNLPTISLESLPKTETAAGDLSPDLPFPCPFPFPFPFPFPPPFRLPPPRPEEDFPRSRELKSPRLAVPFSGPPPPAP